MFYVFLFAHLVADFVLQPYWLVKRKRHWDGLLLHGAAVLVCMLAVALVDPAALHVWPAMLAITAVHVVADWWKVHRADQVLRPAILPFLLDQAIHVATLAAALWLALGTAAWQLDAVLAHWALIGSGVMVAALAVPIGVMIWLDPAFSKVALAPAARLRCGALGLAGLLLTLLAGPLALPFGLGGLALAQQRGGSAHPLDTTRGKTTALLVGAIIGAMLRML